jgi:hypothetical protein
MYKYCWFEENRINKKYNKKELYEILKISRMQLDRYFEYLRHEKLILKKSDPYDSFEYINPIYCFKCSNGNRISLIESICNIKNYIPHQDETLFDSPKQEIKEPIENKLTEETKTPKPGSLDFSKVKSPDILKGYSEPKTQDDEEELDEIPKPIKTTSEKIWEAEHEECPWY